MDDINENNQFNDDSQIHINGFDDIPDIPDIGEKTGEVNKEEISDEELERRNKREKVLQERRNKEAEKEKRKKQTRTTLIIFCIILFLLALAYFGLTNMMPNHLMNQGKKYLQIQQYDKALKMFKMASSARPYDEEPLYYQVLALSKMPQTYQTQMALYEISQYEDCDKASEYADEVLSNMKRQLERAIGPNYADNILYDDIVFRWNTKYPIKYMIVNNSGASYDYEQSVREAFKGWKRISNGALSFSETQNQKDADIVVNLVKFMYEMEQYNDKQISGETIPVIENNRLEQVKVNLKAENNNDPNNIGRFATVAKHEIGHALGIGGHSTNPDDIMYHTGDYINESIPNKNFSDRDANTLTLLYKLVPDVINKPLDAKDYENLFYHYAITTIPGEEFDNEIKRLLADLENNGKDIVKWVDLAINYGLKKQYKRSNSILRSIVPLAKNDSNNTFVILYNMAANSYKMRNYADTEKYLKIAEEYNSTDLDATILEAFNDLKLNRKETAKTKLILLNNKYPGHVEIALKLAYVYNSEKDKTKAKDVIEKLVINNKDALNDRRVARYRAYISRQDSGRVINR